MALEINPSDLKPGDVVRLQKAHPCGGYEWLVNRADGDIGLRCQTCGHNIMAPRDRIMRRIKQITRPSAVNDQRSGR